MHATGSTTSSARRRSTSPAGAFAPTAAYATANVNGGVLTYADGTVARLEVVWLAPVLPRSQFVVTGPHGLATLDPPTFGLTVELADGTTEVARAAGRQDRGLLRAPARALRRRLPRRDAAGPGARRGDRRRRARRADRPCRRCGRPGARVMGVVDFHVHQPAAAAYGPKEYLAAMDELGVDVSVVFTYEGLLRPSAAANDSLAAWVAPAPQRLVAFATVDPRDPGAGDEIERCVREHGNARRQAPPVAAGLLGSRSGPAAGLRDGGAARRPDSLPRRHAAVLDAAAARDARTSPSGDADRARPRRPARSLARGDPGRPDDGQRPPLHVRYARLRDACDRRAAARSSGCSSAPMRGLRPEPLPRYAVLRVRQLDELGLDDAQREAILVTNPRRLLAA